MILVQSPDSVVRGGYAAAACSMHGARTVEKTPLKNERESLQGIFFLPIYTSVYCRSRNVTFTAHSRQVRLHRPSTPPSTPTLGTSLDPVYLTRPAAI